MKIHHLNCGSLCPRGGKLLGGAGGPWAKAPMCCHCLLVESPDGLVLVDTGIGVEDVEDPSRLGLLFTTLMAPKLDVAETALRQIADLGFRVSDVRHIVPTHLDLDHAGGIPDFPDAQVHVFAAELNAALNPGLRERSRYRRAQLKDVQSWDPIEDSGGETWFGFSAVRPVPGLQDRILLVPLPGHSRGHCGVAVETSEGWLLHCGDAYFHHTQVMPEMGDTPPGLPLFERVVAIDNPARHANLERLRELQGKFSREVRLICSHDPTQFTTVRAPAQPRRAFVLKPQLKDSVLSPEPIDRPRPRPSPA